MMTEELDARHLTCPLPVLKARKKLLSMEKGAILRVYATDSNTAVDMPLFCRDAGHILQSVEKTAAGFVFVIVRGD